MSQFTSNGDFRRSCEILPCQYIAIDITTLECLLTFFGPAEAEAKCHQTDCEPAKVVCNILGSVRLSIIIVHQLVRTTLWENFSGKGCVIGVY